MKIGDTIRVVQVPSGLQDSPDMRTKTLFELCLGRTFPIAGFERGLIELEVGEVVGEPSYMHSIYIEPALVEVVATSS